MIHKKGVDMSNRALCLASAIVAPLSLAMASGASATEYSLGYSLEAGYEYIENVRMTPEGDLDISGGRFAIPVVMTSKSERLDTSLMGEAEFYQYDEDAWDSDDQKVRARASYLLERGGDFSGYAGYKRDSTRTGEFLDTGITGFEATRREVATAGVSTNQMFTERNGITGGLDYRSVEFDTIQLRDFDYTSGYLGWLHQWTEPTQLRFQVYASLFENDANLVTDVELETETIGAQVGFDSTLSQKMSVSFLVGWARLDTEYSRAVGPTPEDDDANELLLKGSLDYESERHKMSLIVNSEPSGSGNGVIVSAQAVGLEYTYALTERSDFDLELNAGHRSPVDDRIENDRDFARVELGVDYRLSQRWKVAGSYAYSWQEREAVDGTANSNEVRVSIIYTPEKSIWSR